MFIHRLSSIDHISELEKTYEHTTGFKVLNVSSWHISESFRDVQLKHFCPPQIGNAFDYVYTYSIPVHIRQAILEKLGSVPEGSTILISPNNTISIINVINLLKHHGINNVCIVNPSYFSVAHALTSAGISYTNISMDRRNGEYVFPIDTILQGNYDAVWITSPIYSTGVYLAQNEIEKLRHLIRRKLFVVADESFALPGHELIRDIGISTHFISIYCPHKAISCNGYKFSGIVTSDIYEDFLEQWVDVLSGNLPQSCYASIYHYLTPNYEECVNSFQAEIEEAIRAISPFLRSSHHTTDANAIGSLISVYCDNIDFEQTTGDVFFQQLHKKTCTSFYPGWLNGFGQEYGTCFRVNLAQESLLFRQSVQRLLSYLDTF